MKILNTLHPETYNTSFKANKRPDVIDLIKTNNFDIKNLTSSQKEKFRQALLIRDLLNAGLTVNEIAIYLKTSRATVLRTAKNLEMPLNKPKERVERDNFIAKKIMNGSSNQEIMDELNISYAPIKKVKKGLVKDLKLGKTKPPKIFTWVEIKRETERIDDLKEMFNQFKKGKKTKEILEDMSIKIDELKTSIEDFKSRFE